MFKTFRKIISMLIVATMTLMPVSGYADVVVELPVEAAGGAIVGGSGNGTVSYGSSNDMTVTQNVPKMIANWQSFSIGSGGLVHFDQNASDIALNRVTGVSASSIMGRLTADGRVFLVNPNGVLFGAGSQVDVGGLLATTMNITDDNFRAGNYSFTGVGGSVINRGAITAPGGFVALMGAQVENSGSIIADLGTIALVSGNAVTVGLDGQSLISVVIDQPVSGSGYTGAAVSNKFGGRLQANGGKVILTADSLAGIFSQAINNEGVIEANTLSVGGTEEVPALDYKGQAVIDTNGDVYAGGEISATNVDITGKNVLVAGSINAAENVDVIATADIIFLGGNPIQNGGFENGLTGWTVSNVFLYPAGHVSDNSLDIIFQRNRTSGYVEQRFDQISSSELSFWIKGYCESSFDSFIVSIINADGTYNSLNNYSGKDFANWEKQTFNLSSYGPIIGVKVSGTTDFSIPSSMLIDDIVLNGGGVGTVGITAGQTANLTAGGSIIDNNDAETADIKAQAANLIAGGSIGSDLRDGKGAIDTEVESLTAIARNGDVFIKEKNAVNLINIQALGSTVDVLSNGDTTLGNIYAAGNGTDDPGIIIIDAQSGNISMSGGNVTADNYAFEGDASVSLTARSITIGGQAQVYASNRAGRASIDMVATAGDINITGGSYVKAEVGEMGGTALVNINALSYYGGDDAGIIGGNVYVMGSDVKAVVYNAPILSDEGKVIRVPGDGEAEVDINARYKSKYGTGDVNVNNSHVTAQVDDAGNAYIYMGDDQDADVNVTNGSVILATIGHDPDQRPSTAYIGLSGNDLLIDSSSLKALTTNANEYGHAVIELEAKKSISILSKSSLEANVAGYGEAQIDLQRDGCVGYSSEGPKMTITIDDSVLKAIGQGNLLAEQNNSYGDTGIDIEADAVMVNASSLTAVAGGYADADIYIGADAGGVDIKGSSLLSQSVDGEATVELQATPSYDWSPIESDGNTGTGAEAPEGMITVDGSTIGATAVNDDAQIELNSSTGIYINKSDLQVLVSAPEYYSDAEIFLTTTYDDSDVDVINSTVTSRVNGNGHAAIYIYNDSEESVPDMVRVSMPESSEGDSDDFSDILSDLDLDMGRPIYGSITISGSTLTASALTTGDGSEDATAVIYMFANNDIDIENSNISVSEIDRMAAIAMIAGDYIDIHASSLTANSNQFAAVVGLAEDSIDMEGVIAANGGNGGAVAALLALDNVYADGTVTATGSFDTLGFLTGLLDDSIFIDLGFEGTLSSAVLIGSLFGDVTLGNISADLVLAGALIGDSAPMVRSKVYEGDEDVYEPVGGNIWGTANGSVSGNMLLLIARNNIGTAEQMLNTDVDVVAGYSWDAGDIYLNEANDIALGMYIPVFYNGELVLDAGISLAANDGIIHVEAEGDILVNSVIAPRGGVYLGSTNGSIYAGHGWDPYISQGTVDGISGLASSLLEQLGMGLDSEMISDVVSEFMMAYDPAYYANEPSVEGPMFFTTTEEQMYYSPLMLGMPMNDGPNVIAGGYSYFSVTNGTIGVGNPGDAYNGISGQIRGYVDPGVTAVTGLDPSIGLDLTQGVPPGTVYYDNWYSQNGAQQVWPAALTPVVENVNPLKVEINLIEGGKSALPASFAPVSPAGLTLRISQAVSQVDPGIFANALLRDNRAYYELLERFRFQSFEPLTPTGFYAYHPLVSAEMAGADDMGLDPDAYEFIDGNINYNGDADPYKKKKTSL